MSFHQLVHPCGLMAEPTFDCREILISSAALSGLERAGPGDPRTSPETRSCRVSDTCKHILIYTSTCMLACTHTHTHTRLDDCKVRQGGDERRPVCVVMAELTEALLFFSDFISKQQARPKSLYMSRKLGYQVKPYISIKLKLSCIYFIPTGTAASRQEKMHVQMHCSLDKGA